MLGELGVFVNGNMFMDVVGGDMGIELPAAAIRAVPTKRPGARAWP